MSYAPPQANPPGTTGYLSQNKLLHIVGRIVVGQIVQLRWMIFEVAFTIINPRINETFIPNYRFQIIWYRVPKGWAPVRNRPPATVTS